MDHIKLLKRAFSITWNYRALWVFGILLALTSAGGGGGSGGGGDRGARSSFGPSGRWPDISISPEVITALVIAGVALLCLALVLIVVGVVARYVAETALIRMVDQHEATGEKPGVRQGFRLGWSRAALRLFLMDFAIGVGSLIIFLLMLAVAAVPLVVWLTENTVARVLGTVLSVGLGIAVIFVAIVVAIMLSLLVQFFHRAVVLENLGVVAGVRRGWGLMRQRLGDVVVMGLILFGLGLAWVIVLIPVVFLLLLVAAVLGGLPALLVGAVVSLVAKEAAVPWIAAAVVGIPAFLLVMGVPLTFLGGLAETFQSSTWTLTYRELLALEAARPAESGGPEPEPPVAI